jgi:hypothetical protein
MVHQNDGEEKPQKNDLERSSRPPTLDDLVGLCKQLNQKGARYVVIGGWAMAEHGFARTTEDLDLLIDKSIENQDKVKSALMSLPDQAIKELGDENFTQYEVVRVADEIIVDVMTKACGIE